MASLQTFRQYRISQDRNGGTVELWRSGTEVACLAVDSRTQTFVELRVAISPPDKPLDQRAFQQLVQLATPLRHRHLLGVMEGGEDEGANYYVTEFLDGERFDTWLARCNPLPPWLALLTTAQIIEGLCVLAPHPRLIAGVELLHCGISLAGDHVSDLTARVCDLGLAAAAPRQPDPRQTEIRIIQETGRLLLYMLTGSMLQEPVETFDPNAHPIAPELGFLISTLFTPSSQHHPRTLDQLRTLVERCMRDLSPELAARPDKIPAPLRPHLPLQSHFLTGPAIAGIAGDDCTVDTKAFDALDPYRHRATQRATRTAVTVQLLPPDRLMPPEYAKLIVQAGERITPREHPHLLRVLAWDEQEHPELLLEESPGKWTLESMVRLKTRLEPAEVSLVLEELEAAFREAETCGLTPVIRSPRQILVQFSAPGGDETLPGEGELARLPLDSWPAFRLRVRTWPITLNFTQPDRFNPERLIHREPGAMEHHVTGRAIPFAQTPSARDYALLAAWMLGGTGEIQERVRPLIYDHLSNRSEAALGGRRDFLDRFASRAQAAAVPAPVSPATQPVRRTPGAPGGAGTPGTSTPPPASPLVLGRDAWVPEEDKEEGPPVGFAEALFGGGLATAPPASGAPHPLFQENAVTEAYDPEPATAAAVFPGLYQQHPESGPRVSRADDPGLDPAPAPNRLFIWVLVVLISAALAAVAAHLNGTAFWQH